MEDLISKPIRSGRKCQTISTLVSHVDCTDTVSEEGTFEMENLLLETSSDDSSDENHLKTTSSATTKRDLSAFSVTPVLNTQSTSWLQTRESTTWKSQTHDCEETDEISRAINTHKTPHTAEAYIPQTGMTEASVPNDSESRTSDISSVRVQTTKEQVVENKKVKEWDKEQKDPSDILKYCRPCSIPLRRFSEDVQNDLIARNYSRRKNVKRLQKYNGRARKPKKSNHTKTRGKHESRNENYERRKSLNTKSNKDRIDTKSTVKESSDNDMKTKLKFSKALTVKNSDAVKSDQSLKDTGKWALSHVSSAKSCKGMNRDKSNKFYENKSCSKDGDKQHCSQKRIEKSNVLESKRKVDATGSDSDQSQTITKNAIGKSLEAESLEYTDYVRNIISECYHEKSTDSVQNKNNQANTDKSAKPRSSATKKSGKHRSSESDKVDKYRSVESENPRSAKKAGNIKSAETITSRKQKLSVCSVASFENDKIIVSRQKRRRVIRTDSESSKEDETFITNQKKRRRKHNGRRSVTEVKKMEMNTVLNKELRIVLVRLEDTCDPQSRNKRSRSRDKVVGPMDHFVTRTNRTKTDHSELQEYYKVIVGQKISSTLRCASTAPIKSAYDHIKNYAKGASSKAPRTNKPAESTLPISRDNQNGGSSSKKDRNAVLRAKHGIVKDLYVFLNRLDPLDKNPRLDKEDSNKTVLQKSFSSQNINIAPGCEPITELCDRKKISPGAASRKFNLSLKKNCPRPQVNGISSSEANGRSSCENENIFTGNESLSKSPSEKEGPVAESSKKISSPLKDCLPPHRIEISSVDEEEANCGERNTTFHDIEQLNLPTIKDCPSSQGTLIFCKPVPVSTIEATKPLNSMNEDTDYTAIDEELMHIIDICDSSENQSSMDSIADCENLSSKNTNSLARSESSSPTKHKTAAERLRVLFETDCPSPQNSETSSEGDRSLTDDNLRSAEVLAEKNCDRNNSPSPVDLSFIDSSIPSNFETATDQSRDSSRETLLNSEPEAPDTLVIDHSKPSDDSIPRTVLSSKKNDSPTDKNQSNMSRRLLEDNCDVCKAGFINEEECQSHKKSAHSHTCIFCNKLFTYRKSLKEHLVTHEDAFEKFCLVCHKTFPTRKKFVRHCLQHSDAKDIDTKTDQSKEFTCLICDQHFGSRLNLLQHLRYKHKRLLRVDLKKQVDLHEKPYHYSVCGVCPLIFSSTESCFLHLITHTPRELQDAEKAKRATRQVATDMKSSREDKKSKSKEQSAAKHRTKRNETTKIKQKASSSTKAQETEAENEQQTPGPGEEDRAAEERRRKQQIAVQREEQLEPFSEKAIAARKLMRMMRLERHKKTEKDSQTEESTQRIESKLQELLEQGKEQPEKGLCEEGGKRQEEELVSSSEIQTIAPDEPAGKTISEKESDVIICSCHNKEDITVDPTMVMIELTLFCRTCRTLFKTKQCFDSHFHPTEVGRSPKLFCSGCKAVLSSLSELFAHLKEHKGDNQHTRFACGICKMLYQFRGSLIDTASEIMQHMNSCSTRYGVSPPLQRVINSDSKPNMELICDICKNKFAGEAKFKEHLESHEAVAAPQLTTVYLDESSGKNLFICNVCKARYSTLNDFKKHWQRHSMLREKYVCNLCSVAIDSLNEFGTHWSTHKGVSRDKFECRVIFVEVPFRCLRCKLGFNSKSSLDHHLLTHKECLDDERNSKVTFFVEKTFSCWTCEQVCSSQMELDEHVSKHNDPLSNDQEPINLEASPRSSDNLGCLVCCLSFDNVNDFTKHSLSHFQENETADAAARVKSITEDGKNQSSVAAEEPQPQPVSPKKFLRVRNLTELQEKRTYTCNRCHEQYETQMGLYEHSCSKSHIPVRSVQRVETKMLRPKYICEVCKSFQCETEYEMNGHMKVHETTGDQQLLGLSSCIQYLPQQSQKRIFVCSLCPDFRCETEHGFLQHLVLHPMFVCRICSQYKCQTAEGMRQHEASHCQQQQVQFSQRTNNALNTLQPGNERNNLGNPLQAVQSVDNGSNLYIQGSSRVFELQPTLVFRCKLCPSLVFSSETLLKEHEGQYHKPRIACRYFRCELCPTMFISEIDFNQHMASHALSSGLQFLCKVCGMGFTYANHLIEHGKICPSLPHYPHG